MPASDQPNEPEELPGVAIRRHTDRCFHRVEEVVEGRHGGYIVDGILIPREDVAEIVELDADGAPAPRCRKD